jgi:hypothetical protein
VSDQDAPHSNHGLLWQAMQGSGVGDPVIKVNCVHTDVSRVIRLERAIIAAGEKYYSSGSYDEYVADQLRLTGEVFGTDVCFACGSVDAAVATIGQASDDMLGCVAAGGMGESRRAVQSLVAATAALRSFLLFPTSGTDLRQAIPIERIPFVLLCVHKLLTLAGEAGMADLTYQTVLDVFQRYGALVRTAAVSDCTASWSARPRNYLMAWQGESKENYLLYSRIAKSILAKDRKPLGALIAQGCGKTLVGRLARLESLSRRLSGCIDTVGGSRSRPRPSVAKWILRSAPEDVLWKLATNTRIRPTADKSKPSGQ